MNPLLTLVLILVAPLAGGSHDGTPAGQRERR